MGLVLPILLPGQQEVVQIFQGKYSEFFKMDIRGPLLALLYIWDGIM
jgi:hypothetical protein